MDSAKSRQRLTGLFAPLLQSVRGSTSNVILPVAPVIAMVAATLVALIFLAMPSDSLETLVQESGISTLVTAAQPPLGMSARFAIAFLAALTVGGVIWLGLSLLIGARTLTMKPRRRRRSRGERILEPKAAKRGWFSKSQRDDGVPVLRRADAHPDAPARPPVYAARDLGTPFLDVKADDPPLLPLAAVGAKPAAVPRDIPQDLDTPLAAYLRPAEEPGFEAGPEPEVEPLPIMAEPPVPEPSPEPVASAPAPIAAPRFAPHERIETFELTPLVRSEPVTAAQPETSKPLAPATIHDLLARLEAGVQRRAQAVAPAPAPEPESAEPTLEDTLAVLRQLASRVG